MISFELPGAPPLLLNSRMHWRVKHRLKNEWYEMVRLTTLGLVPPEPFQRGMIRYVRYCGYREPDQDNLLSGFKWITDGIVLAGFFPDDSRKHIQIYAEWRPASPGDKRVLVEISPAF